MSSTSTFLNSSLPFLLKM
uniref:Uncharacterized protein n=1 Tax=Rhizophora mucronata TaxID=61149 RepID=A0A2P2QPM0_RHIMU